MEAAKVYLSNDIVTRLTQPREVLYRQAGRSQCSSDLADTSQETAFDSPDDRVMDMETFLSSARRSSSNGAGRASSAPRQRASQEDAGRDGPQRRPKLSREETAERRKSFENFLARQEQMELRKQMKLEQVSKQVARPHTPTLCRKSVEMAMQRSKGTFLQRVAKGALRKEHEAVRRKAQAHDPECTFKPQINETSRRMPGRSAVEMSRGDSLRKETKARLMKLRMEQEELQELTFAPELNGDKGVEGRLKILSEPDTYIRRLQHKLILHSHKKNKAAQEQEMKELEECTFQPEIHDSPAYIKRIVKSLALAKPAREAQAAACEPGRPDWR